MRKTTNHYAVPILRATVQIELEGGARVTAEVVGGDADLTLEEDEYVFLFGDDFLDHRPRRMGRPKRLSVNLSGCMERLDFTGLRPLGGPVVPPPIVPRTDGSGG